MNEYYIDWKKLDEELISEYKKDIQSISKFLGKHGISLSAIYCRLKKLGVKRRNRIEAHSGILEGEKNPNWKGGRSKFASGYVFVRVEKGKYIQEHRYVMEKKLGRKLKRSEIVHHIDESFEGRSDNEEDNLQLTTRPEHNRHHFKGKGKGYCVSFHIRRNKWALVVHDKILNRWKGAGNYKTKEEALEIVEQKYKLLVDRSDRVICVVDLLRKDIAALLFSIQRTFADYEMEADHPHTVSLLSLKEGLEGV